MRSTRVSTKLASATRPKSVRGRQRADAQNSRWKRAIQMANSPVDMGGNRGSSGPRCDVLSREIASVQAPWTAWGPGIEIKILRICSKTDHWTAVFRCVAGSGFGRHKYVGGGEVLV